MTRRVFRVVRLFTGPLLLICLGLFAAYGWLQAMQTARAYRAAPMCTTQSDPLKDNCITVLPATLATVHLSTSTGSATAYLRGRGGAVELDDDLDSVSSSGRNQHQRGSAL